MYGPYIFLIILLLIGIVAKNTSLMVATGFLLLVKVAGTDGRFLAYVQSKGINWGVTIITIAVLVPIATGNVYINYYPLVIMNETTAGAVMNYIAFGILCFMPLVLDLVEDIKWRVLKSRI